MKRRILLLTSAALAMIAGRCHDPGSDYSGGLVVHDQADQDAFDQTADSGDDREVGLEVQVDPDDDPGLEGEEPTDAGDAGDRE